jgi:DNA modification methylase
LRQDIIWHKPNPMPESVTDRCTKAHEYVFLLSKSERYYYDRAAIAEPAIYPGDEGYLRGPIREDDPLVTWQAKSIMDRKAALKASETPRQDGGRWNENNGKGFIAGGTRNKRSVWTVATNAFPEAHFATFPPALIEPCILAGCPVGGTVLDPFGGAGTTGLVADRLQRDAILIELNPEYADMAERRIRGESPLFAELGRE